MLPEISVDQYAAAVEACAGDLLWQAEIAGPPVDAAAVADRIGLVVARNDSLAGRARYVRLVDGMAGQGEQGTIVVGPAERPERLQWAVAHEIGESAAYRVFASLGIRPDEVPRGAREAVASHLAGCLLLPRQWFAADGRALTWDLAALKERYATASHELIARRMLEMPAPIVITLCDEGRVRWRRSNVAARPPRLLPEELAVWRRAHEGGVYVSAGLDPCDSGLELVRCWPVHEPAWKREILRSEIAAW